jgi:hypothetical protein
VVEIEVKPDMAYGQYALTDDDPDEFRARLAKRGAGYAGLPVKLSDGRTVGTVLSAAAAPFPIEAEDGEYYDGAPVVEVQWASKDMLVLAKEAELVIDSERVLLLGDDAGDVPSGAAVEKSRDALLSDELRRGWGFA